MGNSKDYAKRYYEQNKEKISEKSRKRYELKYPNSRKHEKSTPERLKKQRLEAEKRYVTKNAEKVKVRRAKHFQNNKEIINKKRMENPQIRLAVNLRARLRSALKMNIKNGSAVRDLGCSIEQLKEYLESLFHEGMTWENYGLWGWRIDHIIPLSSFNLEDREELSKACHYTNLQPLWRVDNLKKGNRF